MSFICQFCGDYTEGWPVKVTATPDFPAGTSVDEQTKMCRSCKRSINRVESEDGCDWCGGESESDFVMAVYQRHRMDPVERIGSLCYDCIQVGRGEYPDSFSAELKEAVRENNGNECAECGMSQNAHKEEFGQKLHVHHKDGDKLHNKKENLIALCARCHGSK